MAFVCAYDGSEFHGFAGQGALRTVQGELARTARLVFAAPAAVRGASRTDAGVHARGQVAQMELETDMGIAPEQFVYAMNNRLPSDLAILRAWSIDGALDVRRDALWKEYRYRIRNTPLPDVFGSRYALHIRKALDVCAMNRGAQALVGEHDFTAFCAARAQQRTKTRTIYSARVMQAAGDHVEVHIRGNGFLHNMVRIIVGTLIEVGTGRRDERTVGAALATRDRRAAGPTAAAHGLCLWH
ncbi:MAG: tRNA pseudouridine(38-40) synthase TruA, partial [Firmicutes bacterium]|nr:tRNA pseudouridine(38-40) synthase TruA [Bacillota bacterium]